jgi:hypothetical protein
MICILYASLYIGYARIADESTKDHPPIRWVLPPGLSARALSGVFKLDWINRFDQIYWYSYIMMSPVHTQILIVIYT